jgi:hypothetical protein
MTISAQKFPKAQCIRRMSRANYNDIAQLSIDQQKPAQQERPQKDFTQTCIARHKRAKVFGSKLQDFAPLDHSGQD